MIDYAHKHLFIVQRRALLSDYISPESNLQTEHYTTKYGIYIKTDYQKETYKKIIDCKYDYIKSLFINEIIYIMPALLTSILSATLIYI